MLDQLENEVALIEMEIAVEACLGKFWKFRAPPSHRAMAKGRIITWREDLVRTLLKA